MRIQNSLLHLYFAVATVLALGLAAAPAGATEVRLRIEGNVTSGAGAGQSFQADVTYDSANFLYAFKYFPVAIRFRVGTDVVTNDQGAINVEPFTGNPGEEFDSYQIVDDGHAWTGQIAGVPISSLSINFQDHDHDQLATFDPDQPFVLDLARWEVANGGGPELSLDVTRFGLAPAAPADLLVELATQVIALNLKAGLSNSLDAKLAAVLSSLEDARAENDGAAFNGLEAFVNAVEAQRGKGIPVADADALIADAREIQQLLAGS
jgi:hypothetical protein